MPKIRRNRGSVNLPEELNRKTLGAQIKLYGRGPVRQQLIGELAFLSRLESLKQSTTIRQNRKKELQELLKKL